MNVGGLIGPSIHTHRISGGLGDGHGALSWYSERCRPDVINVSRLLHGRRPRVWRVRALRHVSKSP
eukprot:4960088-Prymnesium_polylepis.1